MKELQDSFTRERVFPGFDKKYCKIDPKILYDGENRATLFYSMLLLSGSDVVHDVFTAKSTDGGKTFAEPVCLTGLESGKDGLRTFIVPNVCAYFDKYTKQALLFGVREYYADEKTPVCRNGIAVSEAVYATFDMDSCTITSPFLPLPLPFATISAVPHGQILPLPGGDVLTSCYFKTEEMTRAAVMTMQYHFGGNKLTLVRTGEPLLSGDDHQRGYCEPSVAYLNGRFYITLRTDEIGLYAVGTDGFTFDSPRPWRWDDGSILENANTMQRWLRFSGGLYLAYTRRGAHNDHVFRNRAPLFFARFDEDRGCLLRDTERILVPELGARLGNFSVTDVSKNECWLTTAEWMQPIGCERYGSDNSLWIARVTAE